MINEINLGFQMQVKEQTTRVARNNLTPIQNNKFKLRLISSQFFSTYLKI